MSTPRRVQVDQFVPAEKAIYDAQLAVEAMPADTRLTKAGELLAEARSLVADFVDEQDWKWIRTVVELEESRGPVVHGGAVGGGRRQGDA